MPNLDTICAISTAPGMGAIAVIRLSGENAISIADGLFEAKSKKKLAEKPKNTLHFGNFTHEGKIIDEVVVSLFKGPHSYTAEDVVEISCHGSVYVQQQILETLVKCGARLAEPGEFTLRAFRAGRMDLSQAEAVSDLIYSQSEAAHKVAMDQMRGGFSGELSELRQSLLNFASLIELELDFSEEDVEFANRDEFVKLIRKINLKIGSLIESFKLGNALKEGVPVAIIGNPNAGKSTLLNKILKEDKAIVSNIPGTTRDVIEDTINVNGIQFRFIDTAGIRDTKDVIEKIGIDKTYESISRAQIILQLIDLTTPLDSNNYDLKLNGNQLRMVLLNKKDQVSAQVLKGAEAFFKTETILSISAQDQADVVGLLNELSSKIGTEVDAYGSTIVTNVRHVSSLSNAQQALTNVLDGLSQGLSTDLLSIDIRAGVHYLGEITGEISSDEILGNIFKNFCIGK